VDKVVSVAKKRVEKFSVIAKESIEQIRQYQEVVSELIDMYKEHNFVDELNSQIPETVVAKRPMRLCGRWAEFTEGKPELSTWQSFGNWLEKEPKISESKQRWIPDKKEWKWSDSSKGDGRKITGHSEPGLFAGATGEHPSGTGGVAKKCPIHQFHHTLQECQNFKGMSTSEKENIVGEHNLCLSCLLPGHRLSQCRSRNRCTVENCGMRHHTLVHEVDLKFIERARVKHQQERIAETEGDQALPSHQEGANAPQNQAVRESAVVVAR